MANSILQGNMPFDRSIYSKADVDKIVEEHSHYIVSPAGSTYIMPTDEGNGVIDRTIEVNKYLSITFGVDPTTGKATIDGYIPAHEGVPKEIVWSWTAPDAPAGGNYVMDLVGPFTSKDGSQVYVPSTSPVHDGFDPEAFYANLWGEIVEETSPIRLSFESGTEIRSWRPSFLIPINSNVSYDFSSVDITSDWSLVCPDDGLPGDYGHPCLRIRRVDGHLELYISDPLASFSIEDDGTLVQTGTFQIYPPAGKPVPSVEMIGAGTFAIRYKNFPQWFTFDERGSFEGNNAEMAEGSCQGVYYEDTPSEVISDRRVIATLDDITEVVGVKYATQSPLGESDPVDNVVTVFHMPSGVAAGSYGEESDRTVAPGESFVVTKNGVNATGHVADESEVSITLDVSAGNVMMGYDSNDRTVSEVIEEIQEEIGGGGGGSITERLDRLDDKVADLSNDLVDLSNDVYSAIDDLSNDIGEVIDTKTVEIEGRIDGLSNDLANHTHDRLVSEYKDTRVIAAGNGAAYIEQDKLGALIVNLTAGTFTGYGTVTLPDDVVVDMTEAVRVDNKYVRTIDGIDYWYIFDGNPEHGRQFVVDHNYEFDITNWESRTPSITFNDAHGSYTGTATASRLHIIEKRIATTDQIQHVDIVSPTTDGSGSGKAADANATGLALELTQVFSEWTPVPNTYNGLPVFIAKDDGKWAPWVKEGEQGPYRKIGTDINDSGQLHLEWPDGYAAIPIVADRSVIGYTLGDQDTKRLAAVSVNDRVDDLSEDVSSLDSKIDDLSNDVNSRLDDLSNDIGEVIDTKLTEIEGRIDDLSNDVSLRAMDDNVVHKTGPLVEGQTIEVPIGIQTGSTELVEASGLGITTPSLPDIGKPEIRTWFWGNDEGTDPDTGDTVEGMLGAGINLRLSPNDRRGVELVREATWNGSRFVNSASIWYGDNEIKIPEKSGTIALEEYMPVPSDETPKMDGTASPGTGAQASRWDHVHPSDSSKLDVADVISQDISYLDAPLYVNLGDYHKGDIVRTSYDIASCIGGSYFRAKKDTRSATSAFSSGDWCNDSKRNEYWEALGDSATVNRGDIVSYKGDLYRVKSDTWLTNADYHGSFQSELDFYLEKISLDDVDKSYIKEEAYGSRATIGQSSLTLSLQGQAPLVPFTLAIPDGFKLYWENGSSPHEVMYSAPSGGTTISFSTPPVYDQSYERYVLVPDGYTFVDMDTMFRTDNLLWFESADPNSDSWGLDVGSAHGASGTYLGFDDFKSPNPTARYAQFGWTWANKVPAISRTAVSPVSKTVATEDQLPVPAVSAPLPDSGTASVGVSAKYAREDHQHPVSDRIVSQDGSTTVKAENSKNATITYPTSTITSVFFPEGFSITSSGYTYTAPSGGETITFKGPYRMTDSSGYSGEYIWYPTNLPNDPQEEIDPSSYNPWRWFMFGSSSSTATYLLWGGNFGFSITAWGSEHPTLTVDQSSTTSGDPPAMTRSGSDFVTRNLAFSDHTHASIVSGDTTVSAVNGGTATITKTVPPTYGNMVVTFPADYSITYGSVTYTGPGTVEFEGPYYNESLNYTFWYPTDLQDDPGTSFDPSNYHVWCLYANGNNDVPSNLMYETGSHYYISEWNSSSPKLTLGYGTVSGSKPLTSRSSSPNPPVTKMIATTDGVVTSVNTQRGDVSLDATNLYMDSTQTQSIAQAVASIPGGGIQSVNGDTGPDVLLDATNLYMDSNDQVTIAEAIDDAHLSPLYSDNRENSIVVTDSGYAELHALRMDGVSLLLHAGYSVSYEGVSYSAQSDEMIGMEGVHVRTIDGVTYYFWLPTTVQDPSDFNPFDGSSESVWYFWKQVDPGSPDADSAVPEFLSYANGPQYTVDGWYTDHTELSLVSGTESGDPPDTMYSKSAVQYKMLSSEDLSYDTPRMDGVPSPGQGEYAARWDHVHPSDSRKVDQGVNDSMFIQPDGAVQVIPAVYLYSTDNGIDANGDNIVTYIQAGSDNGGVFCKLIANESLESDSATVSGSMQLLYRIPVPGGTAYDTAVLFSADANFTRSSATSRSISISNVVTSGHDANGTEFSTTQTYRYIMNGSASIIDYTSTGGSFVINCGPLTWVSGGPDPNTTISIPSIKTLASTKYVDDAISGISGTVISVNGESGIVVLDAGDIMMGYDSNDITIAEAIGGLDDRIGDIDSVLDAINGEVI